MKRPKLVWTCPRCGEELPQYVRSCPSCPAEACSHEWVVYSYRSEGAVATDVVYRCKRCKAPRP